MIIEAAVESLHAALAAQEGGADRIELCSDLLHGGTTPSPELLGQSMARLQIPVFVLVRPRAGDFVFSDYEHAEMLDDIRAAKSAGAAGIVTGALTTRQEIDAVRTAELFEAARPLAVTFHRAFDATGDLEALIQLGADRVLTAGGARTAPEGVDQIRKLVMQAAGRIEILPGGGITPQNVTQLVQKTGVRGVHFSVNDINKVRAIRKLLLE